MRFYLYLYLQKLVWRLCKVEPGGLVRMYLYLQELVWRPCENDLYLYLQELV